MIRAILLVVGATLLLAPIIAGTPDDSVGFLSYAYISLLCTILFGAGAWLSLSMWHGWTTLALGFEAKRVALAFGGLLSWALLSAFVQVIIHHGPAYLGPLLRGFAILAANATIFLLTYAVAHSGREARYALLFVAIVGSAIVAALGVQEYLFVLRQGGDPNTRVNSTSTPDFLAGYLVMMLPVTFALFLGAPAQSRLSFLYGLVVLLQIATIWVSGSRFALVSLLVAFAVFGLALRRATRMKMTVPDTIRRRLLGIGVIVTLAGIVTARPLIYRLQHPQANSAAFRVWTWRGTIKMAQANPLFGTGVGTYLDFYTRYALTGFTRLAHNSYLQMAAECGFPGLLLLMALLGLTGAAAWNGLGHAADSPSDLETGWQSPLAVRGKDMNLYNTSPASAKASWLTAVALSDDRLLLCGLLAGLAAGVVQNLIDSDWYVFFLGIIFWAIAGLAVGIGEKTPPKSLPQKKRSLGNAVGGLLCAFLCLLTLTQGIAAVKGNQAQAKLSDSSAAEAAYQGAMGWDSLNARYPGELGYRVYYREQKNLPAAESLLRQAIVKEPTGVLYRRLGRVLEEQNRTGDAYAAYQMGLTFDPNALDLLLAAAGVGTPEQSRQAYQKMTELETGPVGMVRAIGEITEVKFAIADAALADDAAAKPDNATAAHYYERAANLLEAYAREDGSLNAEREMMSGYQPDPTMDRAMWALYGRVLKGWQAVAPERNAAIAAQAAPILQKFADVSQKASEPGTL